MSSSPAYIIGNLPSSLREGTHYNTHYLSTYIRLDSPTRIREDVVLYGYYLAKGENEEHEARALEKLIEKIDIVLSEKAEKRKNSWANRLNLNLQNGNDKAVASLITSLWRRLLSGTSLKKAQRSVWGYMLNGNNLSKGRYEKEIKALCEWCSKEIHVPINKGFTCPHCRVYFSNFQPQQIKIKHSFENFYFENFENDDEKSVFEKLKIGEFELKKAKKANAAQLVFAYIFEKAA